MRRLSFVLIFGVFVMVSLTGCMYHPVTAGEGSPLVSDDPKAIPEKAIESPAKLKKEIPEGDESTAENEIPLKPQEELAYMEKTPFGYVKRLDKKGLSPEPPSAERAVSLPSIKKGQTSFALEPIKSTPRPKAAPYFSPEENASASRGNIVLNFDDADLYEVVKTFSEMLNINYIIPQPIKGTITIRTKGGLRQEDIFPIFYQVLDANGLTMVKEGLLYKIVESKESTRLPVRFNAGEAGRGIPPDQRISIQIIKLKYISAAEMTTILKPFVSSEGTIVSHADSNTLLLVDKGLVILKALAIIETFDVDMFENTSHRFFSIKNVAVEEVSSSLTEILKAYKRDRAGDIQIIPMSRLNTLLVVSSDKALFERVEGLIYQLDQSNDDVERKIYVYFVKNGKAADLASILGSVFTGTVSEESLKKIDKTDSTSEKKPDETPKLFQKKESAPKEKKAASGKEDVGGSSTLKGAVTITPDEIRNALIIESAPSDYRIVETLLKKIDVLPRQVLIEVTIAEVTLSDSMSMGVGWSFKKSRTNPITGLTEMGMGVISDTATGFNYTVNLTDKWIHALNASASKNNLNIISSPIILASDNKEAKIQIKTEYPVASAEYKVNTGGDNNVIETNVQYRDTGVILSVTPHINARGLVTMDINQEVSNPDETVFVGGKSYPSFRNRSLSTSLTVNHAQSIVIGGLMTETRTKAASGVPFLIKLPFIGRLFGVDENKTNKTELILLITPRVINSLEDADSVTQEFKNRVSYNKK